MRIPEGVTQIENRASHGCSGLTSVTIQGTGTVVAGNAFDNCDRLTVVMVAPPLVERLCAQISFDNCPHFHDGILPVSARAISKVLAVRFWTPRSHRLCTKLRRRWIRAILLTGIRLRQPEGLQPPPLPVELWYVVLGMLELYELGQAS